MYRFWALYIANLFLLSLSIMVAQSVLQTMDDSCPSLFYLPLSTSQMRSINLFTTPSVKLHVFPHLEIPCEGVITSWRFLSKIPKINGLNLAVFRWSRLKRGTIILVAESYIDNFTAPDFFPGKWVTFSNVPPVKVSSGDFLGFYYDDLDMPEDELTVLTKGRPVDTTLPAFILDKSADDVCINCPIDLNGAANAYEEPALLAVITGGAQQSRPEVTLLPRTTPAPSPPQQVHLRQPILVPIPSVVPLPIDRPPAVDVPTACQTRPAAGLLTCFKATVRYYYDSDTATCVPGLGCPLANTNNFAAMGECIGACIAGREPATVTIMPDYGSSDESGSGSDVTTTQQPTTTTTKKRITTTTTTTKRTTTANKATTTKRKPQTIRPSPQESNPFLVILPALHSQPNMDSMNGVNYEKRPPSLSRRR